MEEPIKKLLVTVDEGIQFMGKCEYHMKVRGIDHFCPAFVYPDFFLYSLTVGTVPVAAGVIVKFHMPAVRALGDIYPELSGFTVQDGPGGFTLDI